MLTNFNILCKINKKFCQLVRYWFYRKINIKRPIDLISLYKLENDFFEKFFENYYNKNKFKLKQKILDKLKNKKKLRIGFFYCPAGHMSFPLKEIFSVNQVDIELFLYEFCCRGKCIGKNLNIDYKKIEFLGLSSINKFYKDSFNVENLLNFIKDDKIDVLVLMPAGLEGFSLYRLINELDDLVVIHISAGSSFIPHIKIDIMSNPQLPINYEIRNNKLIEINKNMVIDDYFFVDDLFLYSNRGIEIDYTIRYPKEPVIFIHSRLSKLANEKYLWTISEILKKDKKRKFVFMGLEKEYLDFIFNTLKKFNIDFTQIEYLGSFNANADETGNFVDKGWNLCKKMLKESSVFCEDFPRGGGSSVLEAYASGLPTIRYKSLNAFNKIKILDHSFEVFKIEDYIKLADRLLNNDICLREKIINKQYEIANKYTSGKYFIENLYNTIKRYVNENNG